MTDVLADACTLLATTKPVFGKDGRRMEDAERVYHSFREAFGSDAGQRVLAWIAQEGGLLMTNEAGQSEDTAQFMAGKRYMAQWILNLYAAKPPKPQPEKKVVSPLDRK